MTSRMAAATSPRLKPWGKPPWPFAAPTGVFRDTPKREPQLRTVGILGHGREALRRRGPVEVMRHVSELVAKDDVRVVRDRLPPAGEDVVPLP